jgi:hypothetical protein
MGFLPAGVGADDQLVLQAEGLELAIDIAIEAVVVLVVVETAGIAVMLALVAPTGTVPSE